MNQNLKIKKRDGKVENFDSKKIEKAVQKAFLATDKELTDYAVKKSKAISAFIMNKEIMDKSILSVEEIQDMVEYGLMSTKRKDVARNYILYRQERTAERMKNNETMKVIREKLAAKNVKNQNANVDEHSFGGRMGEANEVLTKQYALDYIISPMAKENHLNNEIYIHDLGSYAVGSHNCLSIPFDDLLANGFKTRQTDIRPAQSINTAFQLVAVIFQLQSLQQFGGVASTHLDWTMVPYVRKSFYKHYKDGMKYFCNINDWNLNNLLEDSDKYNDIIQVPINDYNFYINMVEDMGDFDKVYQYAMDMTVKEIYQAVEAMYHNLNY